jgi:imidazolonepropionase
VTTVVDGIARLVTNTDVGELAEGWVVVDGGAVAAVGTGPAPSADHRIDAGGRCVIPGFVDSHTHLVFAGDRSAEFAARMAGAPYAAGGINTTIAATRAAPDDVLRALAAARRAEAARAGITTIEVKSGYGATVDDEARLVRLAAELTPETTFLGAHVVPDGVDADAYVDLVCGEMLSAATPHARWIDAFCERGAFDADQCRAVLTAGRDAGLGLRLHANQLGPGPGVQLAVELGCASADHCTYLSDDDVAALAGGDTVATFLPATDFSTRQPYPDARRVLDAGATVALATNCNPGSSYTTSMSFVIALAVRDLHMTATEAVTAATLGGARALRRRDVGWLGAGSRADLVVVDAPSYEHLVYRPGVPLIHDTVVDGTSLRRACGDDRDEQRRGVSRRRGRGRGGTPAARRTPPTPA